MGQSRLPLTLEQVQAAEQRIRARIHHTPVMTSRTFDRWTGGQTLFKCECLQRGGSFKVRGAMHRLTLLTAAERQRGVVAFSSGNHAQGVAIAAQELGISATIVMPTDAPQSKLQATQDYGATVVTYNRQREDREAITQAIGEREGRVVVPPFDDLRIMAGQGTTALELQAQVEELRYQNRELQAQVGELDLLVVPVGGSGLLSGCSVVARAVWPQVRIYGVEVETGNDTYLSLQQGRRVSIPVPETLADGIRTTCPGELTFAVIKELVDGILLVSDAEILEAMRFFWQRMKLIVEPTGAVAAAAVLSGKISVVGQRVGVILSGGNVDPEILTLAL